MVEQICPRCKAGNVLESRYCGQCGAELGEGAPEQRPKSELSIGGSSLLPAQSVRQVGRAVAVSLVALAAEAGLSWLRRRVNQVGQPRPAESESSEPVESAARRLPGRSTITISSQRIVRIWQRGRLTGQAVEQSIWQIEE